MALPTRPLGTSRLHITAVGYGARATGGVDDLDEVAGAIGATGAGRGPVRPPVTVP